MKKPKLIVPTVLGLALASLAPWSAPPAPPVRTVDVYFSPSGGAQEAILAELRQARTSIDVAMFTFTNSALADELVLRAMNGIAVRVLLDANEAKSRHSKARDLVKGDSKVQVARTSPPPIAEDITDDPAHFHHKFCVIDGKKVLAGSYNWTRGAEMRNHEDLLVIDMRPVARDYQVRFDALWAKASPGGD
jgi:phosphatidylserine/phosphatidylglycerophosphate/cardiolipin synthase-like enzyme